MQAAGVGRGWEGQARAGSGQGSSRGRARGSAGRMGTGGMGKAGMGAAQVPSTVLRDGSTVLKAPHAERVVCGRLGGAPEGRRSPHVAFGFEETVAPVPCWRWQ